MMQGWGGDRAWNNFFFQHIDIDLCKGPLLTRVHPKPGHVIPFHAAHLSAQHYRSTTIFILAQLKLYD